jgi:hypothetical protein
MPEDDGLDALSSHQLHDLAVRRAKRHLDVRFFYRLAQALPAAEAAAGNLAESENDIYRLSGHINDLTDSGKGDTAELLRPLYLEYLRKHHVTAEAGSD